MRKKYFHFQESFLRMNFKWCLKKNWKMGLILYILSMVENDPITDSVMNFPIFKYHPRKRLVLMTKWSHLSPLLYWMLPLSTLRYTKALNEVPSSSSQFLFDLRRNKIIFLLKKCKCSNRFLTGCEPF